MSDVSLVRWAVERAPFVDEIERQKARGQFRAVIRERDEARAAVRALTSALERTEDNLHLAVMGKPVREMAENLAENESARSVAALDGSGVAE